MAATMLLLQHFEISIDRGRRVEATGSIHASSARRVQRFQHRGRERHVRGNDPIDSLMRAELHCIAMFLQVPHRENAICAGRSAAIPHRLN